MNVVSIDVCVFLYICVRVIGCWVICPFSLSIYVSMTGVLFSCIKFWFLTDCLVFRNDLSLTFVPTPYVMFITKRRLL